MDSAPKNHIETTLEVLFLKNAYCILSMAIYLFWNSTKTLSLLSAMCSHKTKPTVHVHPIGTTNAWLIPEQGALLISNS